MPLVFVHGVATRQSRRHQAQVHQRDALFKQLVLRQGAAVFDPDWGSDGVKFDLALPWMPEPGGAQPFDIAFEAGLAARAEAATRTGNSAEALTTKELEAFGAAVRYLEAGADKSAFDPLGSDAEFLSALAIELKPHSPNEGPAAEPMSSLDLTCSLIS